MVGVCVGLLVGYCALLTFVPVPDVGAGHFEEGMNLTNYVDKQFLPLFKWDGDHDPEGLLSTAPAVATCLLGVFAGLLLRRESMGPQWKVICLLGAGAASIAPTAIMQGGKRLPTNPTEQAASQEQSIAILSRQIDELQERLAHQEQADARLKAIELLLENMQQQQHMDATALRDVSTKVAEQVLEKLTPPSGVSESPTE